MVLARRTVSTIGFSFAALALVACAKGSTFEGSGGAGGDTGTGGWGSSSSSGGPGSGGSSSSAGGAGSSSSSSTGSGGGGPNTALPIMVLRVGDGFAALTNAATDVYLDRMLTDGSLPPSGPSSIALPQTTQGANQPLTLSGTATSQGLLSLSSNGKYVLLAGYAAPVGTASVATTTSDVVPRVVGRVDGSFVVNTQTTLGGAFSAGNVRGAASSDGNALWVSGNASSTGGVHAAMLGVPGSTQILVDPSNTRGVLVAAGQLYGTSGAGTFVNVFTIGAGLPTTAGQTATSFPGMPTSLASPYSFALLDRSAAVPGVDTLYVADDLGASSGGGIQKWISDGFTWTLVDTFSDGTNGVRGLAAAVSGSGVRVVATTTELPLNKVITLYDDDISPPTVSVIATAPTNTAYRGVAFAPQ